MRGISQNVDKMNVVPQFLLVYELWEMQQFAWRGDMIRPHPCSLLATAAMAALEVFIIVINIFVRKRGIGVTQEPGRALLKEDIVSDGCTEMRQCD